jgi:hypothetical protein
MFISYVFISSLEVSKICKILGWLYSNGIQKSHGNYLSKLSKMAIIYSRVSELYKIEEN